MCFNNLTTNPIRLISDNVLNKYGHAHPDVLLLDGGLATELERNGSQTDGHPLWSAWALVNAPEEVKKVHERYYLAGANVATTATYQASFLGFQTHLNATRAEYVQIIHCAVSLAREARKAVAKTREGAARDHLMVVAGSIGPFGAYLANGAEYTGDYDNLDAFTGTAGFDKEISVGALVEFHRPLATTLVDGGADVLLFETIPSGIEVEAILNLVEELSPIPVWISLSMKKLKEDRQANKGVGVHLADGTPIESVLAKIRASRVCGVGVNCLSLSDAADCVSALVAGSGGIPVIVYPNSGEEWDAGDRAWKWPRGVMTTSGQERQTVEEQSTDSGGESEESRRILGMNRFAEMAAKWCEMGAQGVGGCCRTCPEFIAAVAKKLDRCHGIAQRACVPESG